MYENQLAQLSQQTFNMESAALATENLRNTMATVDAMKQANKELRKQYGKIDIDKIEVSHFMFAGHLAKLTRLCFDSQNIHYEMEDLLEQANEIQESLGRSYAVPDELDEADLQAGALLVCLYLHVSSFVSRQSWTHWSSRRRKRVLRI